MRIRASFVQLAWLSDDLDRIADALDAATEVLVRGFVVLIDESGCTRTVSGRLPVPITPGSGSPGIWFSPMKQRLNSREKTGVSNNLQPAR
jgi:hypothetical protein